jgi:TonB family protein
MKEVATNTTVKADSTDTLLWLGGLIVAGVGISWLFMTQPWVSEPSTVTSIRSSVQPSAQTVAARASAPELESILDNPIRMARLAFEAGMLVEPENYSAWSLYEQILNDEPDHTEALQGLRNVAEVLVQRGSTAFEQGRIDDAQSIVNQILAALPDHAGAQRLAEEIDSAVAQAAAQAAAQAQAEALELAAAEVAPTPVNATEPAEVTAAEPISIDPLPEILDDFETALANNLLLTPAEQNAKYFVALLASTNSDDERTVEARERLFDEFIERANQAIELQDTQGAETWIDEAELLEVSAAQIADTRGALTALLIDLESLKRVPASALELVEYSAPTYPTRAATRGIEGWVDLEFIVTVDGATQDVAIMEASHESYFRREAVAAVEEWRFGPRTFMGQTIEQRAYTRVVFRLQ